MSRSSPIVAALAVVLGTVAARAAAPEESAPTLKVGDPAPPLVVGNWVKGGAVPELKKGKVYVLEFWATWCGPCISVMPHVTKLQKDFADEGVVVIGVSVWEPEAAAVEPFVQERGDRIGYALATDPVPEGAKDGPMAKAWMRAAGLNAIPATFIVDRDGRIAWIGHPRRMDRPLRLIAAGTFDAAAEAAVQAGAEAKRLADEAAVFALLRDRGLSRAMDDALATTDRLIALDEGSLTTPTMEGGEPYGMLKLRALMTKGDYAAAGALAAELERVLPEEGGDLRPVMNVLAWAPDLSVFDTDLLLRLAKGTADRAAPADWKAQRMLATVYAARREYGLAVEAQRRALAGAPAREKPWEEARLKIHLMDQAEAAKAE